jgi:hypothetical protein
MAATQDPSTISPKVKAGATGGGLLLIAVAVGAYLLENITPELLDFLGPWAPLISGAIVLAGTLARSYYVGDPLRQNYWAQKEADEKVSLEQAPAEVRTAAVTDQAEVADRDLDAFTGRHAATPQVYEPEVNGSVDDVDPRDINGSL